MHIHWRTNVLSSNFFHWRSEKRNRLRKKIVKPQNAHTYFDRGSNEIFIRACVYREIASFFKLETRSLCSRIWSSEEWLNIPFIILFKHNKRRQKRCVSCWKYFSVVEPASCGSVGFKRRAIGYESTRSVNLLSNYRGTSCHSQVAITKNVFPNWDQSSSKFVCPCKSFITGVQRPIATLSTSFQTVQKIGYTRGAAVY